MTQQTQGAAELRRLKEARDVGPLRLSKHNCKIEPSIRLAPDAEVIEFVQTMAAMDKDATSFHKYSSVAMNEQIMRQLFVRVVTNHANLVYKKKEQHIKGGDKKKNKKDKKKKKKQRHVDEDEDEDDDDDGGIDITNSDNDEDLMDEDNDEDGGADDDYSRTEHMAQALTQYNQEMEEASDGSLKLDCQLLLEPILHKSENEPGTDKNSTALKDRKVPSKTRSFF